MAAVILLEKLAQSLSDGCANRRMVGGEINVVCILAPTRLRNKFALGISKRYNS